MEDLITKKLKNSKKTKAAILRRQRELVELKKYYCKSFYSYKYENFKDVKKNDFYLIGAEYEIKNVFCLDYLKVNEIKKILMFSRDVPVEFKKYLDNEELFTQYYRLASLHHTNVIVKCYFVEDVKKVVNKFKDNKMHYNKFKKKGYFVEAHDHDPIPF